VRGFIVYACLLVLGEALNQEGCWVGYIARSGTHTQNLKSLLANFVETGVGLDERITLMWLIEEIGF
jgi:hypothetical protein